MTIDPHSPRPQVRLLLGVALVLVAVGLGLRLLLVLAGGVLGEAVQLQVGPAKVAAILFRSGEPGGARPLLIAAHGGLATKETLLGACWEARQRGADCVTLDTLGHGASSRLPRTGVIAAMRRALHVERALGTTSAQVRFLGHSLGAHLGCGAVFPCGRSVAIGSQVDCDRSTMVFGNLHRALGLPSSFYLPVSHVLEPWTPQVLDTALNRVLPSAQETRSRIATRVVLAWSSFAVLAAAGVVLAAAIRRQRRLPSALRGLAGAAAIFAMLIIGGWRALWWLVPLQRTDLLILGPLLAAALVVSQLGRAIGLRHPLWGVCVGVGLTECAAILCWGRFPADALNSLLLLPVALLLPLAVVVAGWERLSRGPQDSVEAALFTTGLLGTFLALLVPGF